MLKKVNVRLPKDLYERVRRASRLTGLSMSRVVRNSLEKAFAQETEAPWRKFAGIVKGGPPDLSFRKGFSRGPDELDNAKHAAAKPRHMRHAGTFSGPQNLSSRKGYSGR